MLDDYVEDIETPDELITWTWLENTHLQVSIVDRIASISVLQEDWIGSDTIIFIATDDDAGSPLSASDTVVFTVTPRTGMTYHKSLHPILYPNPTHGLLTIEFSNRISGEILLQVFSVHGELIITSKQRMLDNKLRLNIQDLLNGNYIIRIVSPDYTESFQITRQ
jgi:hypothetical protein